MNIKLIVLDLDGTLLCSDKSISEYTLSALDRCKKSGIIIAIATARSELSATTYIDAVKAAADISATQTTMTALPNGLIVICKFRLTIIYNINAQHECTTIMLATIMLSTK